MSIKSQVGGLFALFIVLGCRAPSESVPHGGASAAAKPAPPPSSATPSGAQAALDELDKRTPLPLLPMMAHHQKQNMRDHLAAVQQIIAAVATQDFARVEKAAARIGFSETMGQMCSHMGRGAPGFTETALRFHHEADRIAEAARQRDTGAILTSLGDTLSRCTGCHEQYKQLVVDDSGWSAASGGASPPRHQGPHGGVD